MKTVIWLGVLVTAWVYGSGYWAFREAGVNEFLEKWEDATRRGDAQAMCETFTPDMTFSIRDRTTGRMLEQEGDRSEMCAYLQKVLPAMAKFVSDVKLTRDNFRATRHGLHWWTAEVSYTEHRDTTLKSALHLKTISEDRLILVKSFDGLRVRRLESEDGLDR
jgi:hypothetical protein